MSTPADWHPDPTGRHEHRYWDGEKWTDHVADAGVSATDPVDGRPAASTESSSAAETTPDTPDTGSDQAPADSPYTTPPIEPSPSGSWDPAPAGQPAAFGQQPGGYPTAAPIDAGATATGPNPMAVVGMVLGIVSIVMSWLGVVSRVGGILLVLLAIAAIVVSIIGKRRATRGASGNGMAITGIVTGIIGFIAAGLFLAGGEFYRAYQTEFRELFECLEETGDQQACQEEFERSLLNR